LHAAREPAAEVHGQLAGTAAGRHPSDDHSGDCAGVPCCHASTHWGRHSRRKPQDQRGRCPNAAYDCACNVHLNANLCARLHPERSSMVKTPLKVRAQWPMRLGVQSWAERSAKARPGEARQMAGSTPARAATIENRVELRPSQSVFRSNSTPSPMMVRRSPRASSV
jgi:hypothetical protein